MYITRLLTVLSGKILAVVIGLVYIRYLSAAWRIILLHTLLAIITETAGKYVAVELHEFNIWVFNIYWVIELWLLGIAGIMLSTNYRIKKMAPWLLGATTLLWLRAFYLQGICVNDTVAVCIAGVVIVIIYFSLLMDTMLHGKHPAKAPEFWLSISHVLFFSCTIPVHGLYNYLVDTSPDTLQKLYNIVGVLNHVRYPLVALALYLYGSQQVKAQKAVTHVLK